MKEKLTKAEFIPMFEIAWSGTCQSNYSYIEEVGVEQALQDEWESMMDGLEEDYSFKLKFFTGIITRAAMIGMRGGPFPCVQRIL